MKLFSATGSLPGAWERDRLWGEAIAAVPELVRREVRRWEDATLPEATGANSIRIFKDVLPAGDIYESPEGSELNNKHCA